MAEEKVVAATPVAPEAKPQAAHPQPGARPAFGARPQGDRRPSGDRPRGPLRLHPAHFVADAASCDHTRQANPPPETPPIAPPSFGKAFW